LGCRDRIDQDVNVALNAAGLPGELVGSQWIVVAAALAEIPAKVDICWRATLLQR
jgi:hypothetical protein